MYQNTPRLLVAVIISVFFTSVANAQGVFLEGETGIRRTKAENFDLRYSDIRAEALQRVQLAGLRVPMFFGLAGSFARTEVGERPTASQETIESDRLVLDGAFGFSIGEETDWFYLRQIFGPSFQYSEAFDESFFLGGAWLRTYIRIDISKAVNFRNRLIVDILAAGRLGTDSSHASGITKVAWELNFQRPISVKVGAIVAARFLIENLGINSSLNMFNVLVDVELVGAGAYVQVWIFRIDFRYSPPFFGRLTTQSHLGVQNNGPAENFTIRGGIVYDF